MLLYEKYTEVITDLEEGSGLGDLIIIKETGEIIDYEI